MVRAAPASKEGATLAILAVNALVTLVVPSDTVTDPA